MAYFIRFSTGILMGVLGTLAYSPPILSIMFTASNLFAVILGVASGFHFGFSIVVFFLGASLGGVLGLGYRYPLEILLLITLFIVPFILVFIEARHVTLRRRRSRHPLAAAARRRESGNKDVERPMYVLAVLGSGGHTKEMLLMMENEFDMSAESHRRYLVTSGDVISQKSAEAFEMRLRETREHSGSYDVRIATRARRVHQPLLTTPVSALRSILDIFPILLSPPWHNTPESGLNLPDVIFINGPATAFFVALVAHLLKIFYFVPENKMQVLFIESWARVTSLSLTGKLVYYTGIADLFLVQHEPVANAYGVVNAGWLVLPRPQGGGGDVL